jgi:hypothetical protein
MRQLRASSAPPTPVCRGPPSSSWAAQAIAVCYSVFAEGRSGPSVSAQAPALSRSAADRLHKQLRRHHDPHTRPDSVGSASRRRGTRHPEITHGDAWSRRERRAARSASRRAPSTEPRFWEYRLGRQPRIQRSGRIRRRAPVRECSVGCARRAPCAPCGTSSGFCVLVGPGGSVQAGDPRPITIGRGMVGMTRATSGRGN